MDLTVLWRSALVQAASVIAVSLILALALPRSFFEDWGWLTGPAAWIGCALLTARVVGLPPGPVVLGAILAGIPSAVAVIAGVHWLGIAIAIAGFAAWCGWLAARPGRVAMGRA